MGKHYFIVLILVCMLVLSGIAYSQVTEGRWSLGLRSGGNTWIDDFNKRKFGPDGEIDLRYGVSRSFSLGFVTGYTELKSRQQSPQFSFLPYDYLKLHAVPVSLVGWFHLAPGKRFSPYVYVGGGVLLYKREDGSRKSIPNDDLRRSVLIPVGVGFESFVSKRVSLGVDIGFRVIDDWTDFFKYKLPDSYGAVRAGLNVYFGSSAADDDDNDGLTNGDEQTLGTNPGMADTDGDGLKDGEEVHRYKTDPLKTDSDGDGLSDGEEVFKYKTDPSKTDTDGDGLSDGDEVLKYKTDPLRIDTDGDALTDGDEVLRYKSDPLKVDTDGDGLSDWDEVKVYKTDPAKADTDGDGLSDGDEVKKYKTDPLKVDTDGGGVNDGAEVQRGTNPLDPRDDIVKETIILEKGKTVVLEGVNFATGKATLTKESENTLGKAFIAMVANADVKVEIAGYTDNVGSDKLNDGLSLRRAQAVRAWLVKKGIDGKRMTTVGKGKRDPIAPNDTPEGRGQNRRIEFHVMK
jgi:outer membrane protein OmpA-like peptidoglycan-associated protein